MGHWGHRSRRKVGQADARAAQVAPAPGWPAPIWSVLRILGPVIVVAGLVGVVVGLVAAQSTGIVLLDVMVSAIGGILMLILRWSR